MSQRAISTISACLYSSKTAPASHEEAKCWELDEILEGEKDGGDEGGGLSRRFGLNSLATTRLHPYTEQSLL